MSRFYQLLGVHQPFDPSNRYTTSPLLPPFPLALLRLLLSLYAFTTIIFIFAWDNAHDHAPERSRRWFSFFTNLSFCGLAFYTLFAGLHTLSYALRGRSWLSGWPRPLQAAHAVFWSTVVVFPLLVTIVFWVLLYEEWFAIEEVAWSNITQHGLNSLYALFEIFLTRVDPPPILHLPFLIFILALYLSLAYLSHATQGFFPYDFLDPVTSGSGLVAGYSFGILAAVIIIFGVVWALVCFRGWVTRRTGLDYDRGARKRRSTLGGSYRGEIVEMRKDDK